MEPQASNFPSKSAFSNWSNAVEWWRGRGGTERLMNLSTVTQLVRALVGIHPRNCFVEIGDGSREEGDRTPSPAAYSVMERECQLGGGGQTYAPQLWGVVRKMGML